MTTDKQKNKEQEERKYLNCFLKSSCGQRWLTKNKIIHSSLEKSEEPDFLFETVNGKKIGLEMTRLIVPNENTKATQQLITVGNQARAYFKQKYGFDISLIIDKYDKRKWSGKRSDYIDACYHPGFAVLPSVKELKDKIIRALDNNVEQLKKRVFIDVWIEVESELFKLTVEACANPFVGDYVTYVNNVQRCIEKPFEALQNEINKKNQKIINYMNKCDECSLLVVIPDVREGCSCHFKGLSLQFFKTKFSSVFLYDADSDKCFYLKKSILCLFNLRRLLTCLRRLYIRL